MSCFVASIGKLWGDSGLKDLLIESSVYAAGSVVLSFLDTYAWLYIPLTCHLALRLQLEHTTQQNTQVCIPKENCYIQSKMV
jgi:hypothetical protein